MATMACSVNGLPVHAFGQEQAINKKTRNSNGKILVLIRLSGGNDGLNTLVPLDQYSALSAARSNILLPSSSVLSLNGTNDTGLHPAMTAMQNLYNNGKLNIIQGVSYPDPNYSHFRATDIFSSASDSSLYINSGWIGRFIENQFTGAPLAYPNPTFLDPLSIEIGYQASSLIYGNNGLNGMTVSNIDYFYNIQNNFVDPAPNTKGGNELTYVRLIAQQTESYTSRIQLATQGGTNSVTYPSNNDLADQLKIVAKLISGGLQTPVYIVTINGFDTHNDQVDSADHTQGEHASLLGKLSSAIGAFQQDLENQSLDNKVVGMTFSEFGRRIKSNGSAGTDHGTSEPVFVFGSAVNPAIIGANPVLPANATVNDDLPLQHDFRQIYSTILTDWFGVSASNTQAIMNGNNYNWLPIFSPNTTLPISLFNASVKAEHCEALISWETASDELVERYDILYSVDALAFEKIGAVEARSNGGMYTFKHNPSHDLCYYKIRIVQKDSTYVDSAILSLRMFCDTRDVLIYPNPADTQLSITIRGSSSALSLTLLNIEGAVVRYGMNQNDTTLIPVYDLPEGVYTLVLTDKEYFKEFHKVVIKHA